VETVKRGTERLPGSVRKDLLDRVKGLQRLLELEDAAKRKASGEATTSAEPEPAEWERLSAGEQWETLSPGERRGLRDPEIRKNLEIVVSCLSDAIELGERGELPAASGLRLVELVNEPRAMLHLETLLETRRSAEQVLLRCADEVLLRERTAAEFDEQEATLVTWRRRYGDDLPELLDPRRRDRSEDVEAARERLQQLVAARFALYRPLRARRELRIRSLPGLGGVVAGFAVLFGVAITLALGDDVELSTVLLGAVAGAAGASLSGLLKFRDEVRLGAEVREFTPFFLAQTVVGAVFGLLVVLVGAAGWIAVQDSPAGIGALSFAAGFSEPFALGIVTRLAER
jgi:hypothetical protein